MIFLNIARAALAIGCALLLANCSSGNSNNKSSSTLVAGTSYYMSNGVCYQRGTATPVPSNYCSSSAGYTYQNGYCYNSAGQPVAANYCQSANGTGQYYASNGYCYQTGTNQVVNYNLCSSNMGYGGSGYQSCQGAYYQYTGYGYQTVYCSGYNCSGATLYDQQGYPVTCN